jgi:hypothetical protein
VRHQLVVVKLLGGVEGQVLQEVRHAALLLSLGEAAHADNKRERGARSRPRVAANQVPQAVW